MDVAGGTVTVASGMAVGVRFNGMVVGVRFTGVAVAASTMAPVVGDRLPGSCMPSAAIAVMKGCDVTGRLVLVGVGRILPMAAPGGVGVTVAVI